MALINNLQKNVCRKYDPYLLNVALFFSLQIWLVLRTFRFHTKNYSGEFHFIEFYDVNCFDIIFLLKAIYIQESLRIANVFNHCGS